MVRTTSTRRFARKRKSTPRKKATVVTIRRSAYSKKKSRARWNRRHRPIMAQMRYTKYRFVNNFPVNFKTGTGPFLSERVITFNRFRVGSLGSNADCFPSIAGPDLQIGSPNNKNLRFTSMLTRHQEYSVTGVKIQWIPSLIEGRDNAARFNQLESWHTINSNANNSLP